MEWRLDDDRKFGAVARQGEHEQIDVHFTSPIYARRHQEGARIELRPIHTSVEK